MFAPKYPRWPFLVRDARRGATRWLVPLLVGLVVGLIGGRLMVTPGVLQLPLGEPWPSRLLAWVLLVFLMPVFAFPLTQGIGRRRTRASAVGLILGPTGFAGLAAHGLFGSDCEHVPGAVMLVMGIAISLVYNWCILWKLDDEQG
jgi:hypothetical protein